MRRPRSELETPVRCVIKRAARDSTNLIVGGAALVAAPLFGWWFLVLGIITYLALVGWRTTSPAFCARALAEAAAMPPLPDPLELGDPHLQATVGAIRRARIEANRVLERAPREVGTHVRSLLPRLQTLEGCAARLIERGEELHHYLKTVDRGTIEAELRRLNDLAKRATADELRREYEGALAAREEQLAAFEEVIRARDAVRASLVRLVAAIEALPSRILRLRLLDAQAREDLTTELDYELSRMNEDLATSERSFRTLGNETAILLAEQGTS
jgi:hypothetical protein